MSDEEKVKEEVVNENEAEGASQDEGAAAPAEGEIPAEVMKMLQTEDDVAEEENSGEIQGEEESPASADVSDEPDEIDLELVEQLGLSKEDVEAFGSNGNSVLKAMKVLKDKEIAGEESSTGEERGDEPPAQSGVEGSKSSQMNVEDTLSKLREDGFDESDAIYQTVQALAQQVDALSKERYVASQEQYSKEAQGFLGNLPPQHQRLFKNEDGTSTKEQEENLKQLFKTAEDLSNGYAKRGRKASVSEVLNSALGVVLHSNGSLSTDDKSELLEQLSRRQGSIVSRPAGSRKNPAPEKTTEKEAVNKIGRLMKEFGLSDI